MSASSILENNQRVHEGLAKRKSERREEVLRPEDLDWYQAELQLLYLKTVVALAEIFAETSQTARLAQPQHKVETNFELIRGLLRELELVDSRESITESREAIRMTQKLFEQAVQALVSKCSCSGGATAKTSAESRAEDLAHDCELLCGESADAMGIADSLNSKGAKKAMDKKTIGTVYGPVGRIVQMPGSPPEVLLHENWSSVGAEMNQRIAKGSAFVGPDRIARVMGADITEDDLNTLSFVLNDQSDDELFIVACQDSPILPLRS